jgi:hypothetical protein
MKTSPPSPLTWTWFTIKQINLPPGVLKIGTLTGSRWLVVHEDGGSRDFHQFDDCGYGEEMVTATEHLEDGITAKVTGGDPDLQAVIRAARLFAEQTLAQRRARLDRVAAANGRPKPLIRSIQGKGGQARVRYK